MNPGGIMALVIFGGGAITYFALRDAAIKKGYSTTQLGATLYGVPFRPDLSTKKEFTFKPRRLRSGKIMAGGGGGFEPKPEPRFIEGQPPTISQ